MLKLLDVQVKELDSIALSIRGSDLGVKLPVGARAGRYTSWSIAKA